MGKVFEAMRRSGREDLPSGEPAEAPAAPHVGLIGQTTRELALEAARIDRNLVVLRDASRPASEQYHRLAVSLVSAAAGRNLKRVLIGSAQPGEGRTSVMLNLAGALVHLKKRVLVVDTDLRHPSVLRALGAESVAGSAETAARMTIIKVRPYGFDVLPALAGPENSAELLVSPEFRQALDLLGADYDFILFDSPPLEAGDCKLLARLTDAMLLVIRAGKTTTLQVSDAVRSLTPESLLGVVLNRADQGT